MISPVVHPTAFIHPAATVVGDVTLHEHASVWPAAVLRGDTEALTVGARSNVQDGAVVHADPGFPAVIGAECVIGHRAIVHGAVLEDAVLVGMGAILLNGVHVGQGSVIGAGAVVPEGTVVPPHSLVLGVPGRVVRAVPPEKEAEIRGAAARYVERAAEHREGRYGRA